MPRPHKSTLGVKEALPAVINALQVTREVARVLKAGEGSGDVKNFYTYLIAYCRLIQDHLARFPSIGTDTTSDRLLSQIRQHLESGLCFGSSGHGQEYCDFKSFYLVWNTVRKLDDSRPKIQVIMAYFTGQPSPEQRGKVIQYLEQYEDELRTLYPEDPSSSSWTKDDDFVVHKKVQEPSYGVCRAAQSVFKALTACVDCTCPINHNFGARLSLGTYRKLDVVPTSKGEGEADPGGNQLDFDMFLCMQHDWHEVCIHTPKETVVQWAFDGDAASAPAKKKPPTKAIKTQRVKNLCEPIAKISTMVARRLELKVTRGKLFKLRSEISTCLIDKTKEPVSLEHLLKGGSRSFTERTRRILAVMLSSAVLHLHDTPWLQDTWSSSNVLFFRTTSSAVPLRPFVQAPLSKLRMAETQGPHDDGDDDEGNVDIDPDDSDPDDDLDPDDMDPDDLDPDDFMQHQCPILVMLAVMLMEVYFAVPFSILAKRYDVELSPDHYSESSRSARCLDTELVFRACRSEIPENSQFHRAVEACLDPTLWEDETGQRLEDQALRERMYVEVVLPLETELSQAYSSIALEDLDRFAQSLDLTGWDRTIVTEVEVDDLASAQSSLPDLRMTVSGSSLDPRMTCSTSPSALSAYRPPSQASQTQGGPLARPSPPSHHHQTYPPPFGNIPAPIVVPHMTSPAGIEAEYKASRFFDDEMTPESSCAEYRDWKSRYSDVYEKFIDSEPRTSAVRPIKIAVLDTGIDLTHPDMEARLDNIKEKFNWTNERFKSLVHDRNGHGTFTAGLILDYMPDAELYIAKIADNKPSSPTIIADAINHAVTTWQVDIISMSFGFPSRAVDGYAALESAILNAYRNHVLLFAAASNSGGRLGRAFPARDPNVIAVHAADTFGNRSGFSPTASAESVNLATVGEGVESAWPVHMCDEDENPTMVKVKSGTSYATPILAGIAGFLLLYARLNLPEESAAAESLRRRDKMEKLLKRVAWKGSGYEPRDGYHFVDLSLYADSMFGKTKDFINATIYDVLNE